MFYFRTQYEMDYLDALNGIPSSTIDEWSDMDFVARDSWVWYKAYLRVELRYVRKSGGLCGGCDKERNRRSRWGRAIQSYALHVFTVRD